MAKQLLLVGSYNHLPFGSGEGIYVLDYDTETGELAQRSVCIECDNPSYLVQNGEMVYAVQELLDRGCIASYKLDEDSQLHRVRTVEMPGGLMCHLAIWPGAKFISATNYWTGSLVVCPIEEDATVGDLKTLVQYSGHGNDSNRQAGPHTHSSVVDPSGQWLVVAELGIDRIMVYKIDPNTGVMENSIQPIVEVPAGSGPRHFSFHPNGKWLYVSAELKDRVLCYDFDCMTGVLSLKQSISALPDDYVGENLTADIHVSDDGRFVYVSNRGCDTIAVYEIRSDGSLRIVGHSTCFGQGPRSFRLMDNHMMLITNQGSGNIVVCKLDPASGMIEGKKSELQIPSAVCTLPICGRN